MPRFAHLLLDARDGTARVTLNRPERRNAFDDRLVTELADAFRALEEDTSVRVVILAGAGPVFCAGADLHWMSHATEASAVQATADAERLSEMFRLIDECPCPVIGRLHGRAFGGGVGLAAVCDVALAADDTRFALSEVTLGLVPAIISPFLLRKVGTSHLRRFALTGESFSAALARTIGLVHDVMPLDALDASVERLAQQITLLAPQAVRQTKALLRALSARPEIDHRGACVEANARARVSPEASEGIRAFFEKRQPDWVRKTSHATRP